MKTCVLTRPNVGLVVLHTFGFGRLAWLLLPVFLSVAGSAQGLPKLYDQISANSRPGGIPGGLDLGLVTNAPVGQTFVPQAGALDFIELKFRANQGWKAQPGDQQTIRVDLKTDISGETISSTTPVMFTFLGDSSTRFETEFGFPATIGMNPGSTYFFEVVSAGGKDIFGAFSFTHGGYESGTRILGGNVAPEADLWFRTGYLIPEPSSGALLLLGGLGLAWAAWRRAGPPL